MSPEPLRIRVLDALELGPATVEQLAIMLDRKRTSLRTVCRALELDGLIEMVDTKPARNLHHTGRTWKVYAIRGACQVNPDLRRAA
jgi:hypothetical protein